MFGESAQASKDGSAYKITGSGWQVGTSTTKPFEITATCS
ncbi:MAG: lipoprotein LpqH [Mycobacteriaceae bacterium]|nr:lipoprotein LpqH [Mycobacteriaceae bacterium]